MGASGRQFVEGWASPAAVAAAYEELFAELVRPSHAADSVTVSHPRWASRREDPPGR